jgi:hypothetical protein
MSAQETTKFSTTIDKVECFRDLQSRASSPLPVCSYFHMRNPFLTIRFTFIYRRFLAGFHIRHLVSDMYQSTVVFIIVSTGSAGPTVSHRVRSAWRHRLISYTNNIGSARTRGSQKIIFPILLPPNNLTYCTLNLRSLQELQRSEAQGAIHEESQKIGFPILLPPNNLI